MIDGFEFGTRSWNEAQFEKAAQVVGLEVVELEKDGRRLIFEIEAKHLSWDEGAFFKVEARQLGKFPRTRYGGLDNVIQVTVHKTLGVARFGPKGNIGMTLPGIGLGSYLMSRAIEWLQAHFPEAKIAPGRLAPLQGQDEKERGRRNRFYESHKFDVVYTDDEQKGGSFAKDHAKLLTVKKMPSRWSLDEVVERDNRQTDEVARLRAALNIASKDLTSKKQVLRYVVSGISFVLISGFLILAWNN